MMARRSHLRTLAALLVLGTGACPSFAYADASSELRYSRSQIFSSALRYLRIDLGVEVTEKDADAAYLLFSYVPHGQKEATPGAVEIVETDAAVRLSVKLPRLPSYHETVIRDALVRKLREDYGSERPRKVPKKDDPPKKEPPEEGAPDEEKPEKKPEDGSDA
jgi:hypothetical protein